MKPIEEPDQAAPKMPPIPRVIAGVRGFIYYLHSPDWDFCNLEVVLWKTEL